MPRHDKSWYTNKQERDAEHVGEEEAERRAWAPVNNQTGGGNKPGGSAREKPESSRGSSRTAKKAGETRKRGAR
jgi:hypothetical protein